MAVLGKKAAPVAPAKGVSKAAKAVAAKAVAAPAVPAKAVKSVAKAAPAPLPPPPPVVEEEPELEEAAEAEAGPVERGEWDFMVSFDNPNIDWEPEIADGSYLGEGATEEQIKEAAVGLAENYYANFADALRKLGVPVLSKARYAMTVVTPWESEYHFAGRSEWVVVDLIRKHTPKPDGGVGEEEEEAAE